MGKCNRGRRDGRCKCFKSSMAVSGSSSGTLWLQLLPRHLVQRRKHVTAPDAYASIKASLLTFTKSLSRMGAPKGVRANNISPGMVYVDDGFFGNRKRENPAEYEQMLAFNPGGRMSRPDDLQRQQSSCAARLHPLSTATSDIVPCGI